MTTPFPALFFQRMSDPYGSIIVRPCLVTEVYTTRQEARIELRSYPVAQMPARITDAVKWTVCTRYVHFNDLASTKEIAHAKLLHELADVLEKFPATNEKAATAEVAGVAAGKEFLP